MTVEVNQGLDGVVACRSAVTLLDGDADPSVLRYRGYDVADLASRTRFEDVIHLLLRGDLPDQAQASALDRELRASRALPTVVAGYLEAVPEAAHPLAVLRTAVSMIATSRPDPDPADRDVNEACAIELTAAMPTIVAAIHRRARGLDPVAPVAELGHAANLLYMLDEAEAAPDTVKIVDALLTLYAEHELNASTFAVRVTGGTLSDYFSAIASGLSALKGPLHGGAVDDAFALLETIGSSERAAGWVDDAFARRQLVPGFGHRVYKTGDARTPYLRQLCRDLAARGADDMPLIEVALATDDAVHSHKPLVANVDFYAAAVLHTIGFPTRLFSPFIACSRVVGWSAHLFEQYDNNRLIRPRSEYVGPDRRQVPATREV